MTYFSFQNIYLKRRAKTVTRTDTTLQYKSNFVAKFVKVVVA